MKLPGTLSKFFDHRRDKKEFFLSLFLDPDGVAASVWEIEAGTVPISHGTAHEKIDDDTWEARTEASDTAIASLEQQAETTDFHKVTLGLPAAYLTETGEIKKEVRSHIKKLTEALELTPMGFVPMHQAIVYALKKEEGVPPSVILVAVDAHRITVAVYKIGNLVGMTQMEKDDDMALRVEEALKSFQDLEVLPSRVLLYGINPDLLAEVKNALLRHPWPTRVNFLHFPKIEILPEDRIIGAVTLAGASELGVAIGEGEEEKPSAVSRQPSEKTEEEKIEDREEEIASATPSDRSDIAEEEANVVMVAPEALGFENKDILEETTVVSPAPPAPQEKKTVPWSLKLPAVSLPKLPIFRLPILSLPGRGAGVLVGAAVFVVAVLGFLYWKLPSAIVTIYEIPKTLTAAADIVIDPTATVVDSGNGIIPGQKLEKSISGEKTIAAGGKKQVGDPAKGTVTITNRTLNALSLAKGTVVASGNVQFTLDSTVTVASATAFTLTTATGSITASAIGSVGNLPAGTVFSVSGYSSAEAAAKNDQPLTGGTSRDITVVSRQDMDTLVKTLTAELVGKAKSDLAKSVSGNEILIDETLVTAVADKQFTQELDQEANQLQGKITITVSGVAYKKEDITALLGQLVGNQEPPGYRMVENRTTETLTNVKVKKDGTVTTHVSASTVATPVVTIADIQHALKGKTLSSAKEYLKGLPGIGSASFDFRWTLGRNRLPINPKNISVTVAIQE